MSVAASAAVALHELLPSGAQEQASAVRELQAGARWLSGNTLAIRYRLDADLQRLRIPPPVAARAAADGLWRHTCFEAFVAPAGAAAYREYNFSPSGQWAVYGFVSWRERDPEFVARGAPGIRVERSERGLLLEAIVPPTLLPDTARGLQLGLCAVIEHADAALEYRALHHPAAQPDFHHRGGFVLALGPPPTEPCT